MEAKGKRVDDDDVGLYVLGCRVDILGTKAGRTDDACTDSWVVLESAPRFLL